MTYLEPTPPADPSSCTASMSDSSSLYDPRLNSASTWRRREVHVLLNSSFRERENFKTLVPGASSPDNLISLGAAMKSLHRGGKVPSESGTPTMQKSLCRTCDLRQATSEKCSYSTSSSSTGGRHIRTPCRGLCGTGGHASCSTAHTSTTPLCGRSTANPASTAALKASCLQPFLTPVPEPCRVRLPPRFFRRACLLWAAHHLSLHRCLKSNLKRLYTLCHLNFI